MFVAMWVALGAEGSPPTTPEENPEWAQSDDTQDPEHQYGFFLGLHGAFHVPYGSWTDHLYAGKSVGGVTHPGDLKQVGLGGGGMLELGANTGIHDFTLQLDFNVLSSTDWEGYARDQGSNLSVNIYKWDLNLTWGIELLRISSFFLQARIGIGYMVVVGSEQNHDFNVSYDYDFYQNSFSARAGIGAGLDLTRYLSLYLIVDHAVGVPGVDYPPEGADLPYLGFSFSLGVRLWPVAMFE